MAIVTMGEMATAKIMDERVRGQKIVDGYWRYVCAWKWISPAKQKVYKWKGYFEIRGSCVQLISYWD